MAPHSLAHYRIATKLQFVPFFFKKGSIIEV